ncbi:MAG TPA: DUF1634 domain-containing protein [Candidatus Korarchaeota archaeon]|nr:DUF1634 domain-containing protein [Candidatus Korarchaeota archaeon]
MPRNPVVLESIIGYVLLICVITALLLEVAGLILFLSSSRSMRVSLDQNLSIREDNYFTYTARTIASSIRRPSYYTLMSLGLAILMFTPYFRAILSVAYFLMIRNYKYTLITSFVLIVITVSLLVH